MKGDKPWEKGANFSIGADDSSLKEFLAKGACVQRGVSCRDDNVYCIYLDPENCAARPWRHETLDGTPELELDPALSDALLWLRSES